MGRTVTSTHGQHSRHTTARTCRTQALHTASRGHISEWPFHYIPLSPSEVPLPRWCVLAVPAACIVRTPLVCTGRSAPCPGMTPHPHHNCTTRQTPKRTDDVNQRSSGAQSALVVQCKERLVWQRGEVVCLTLLWWAWGRRCSCLRGTRPPPPPHMPWSR